MKPFFLYILECGDGLLYVGHTDDLERRMSHHYAGEGCEYTRQRMPVELRWYDEFPSRLEALTCERQIKRWTRAKKEALIRGDWNVLRELAKCRSEKKS